MSAERDDDALSELVERAKDGDRAALESLARALMHDIYRLALRMTAHPADAEDATQEILIKIVTRLSGFRGESSIRTWAHRIAVRHVLDRRKSRLEALALDFEWYGADLLEGLEAEPDPDPVAAEEVKLGCTLAMLTCLDREHRLAYILADVFDVAHAEAADWSGVSEPVHRQRVSRARRKLEAFTRRFCGIVNPDAPCRCSRRVKRAEELGRLNRKELRLVQNVDPPVTEAKDEMESLHATARLMRSHPEYAVPRRILDDLRAVVDAGGLHLAREH